MFRASLIAAFAAVAVLPATAFAQASNVDLNRFDGRWFDFTAEQHIPVQLTYLP